MSEESIIDKLIERLGDLIPEEKRVGLRRMAERMAEDGFRGLQQLKREAEEMAVYSRAGAEEAVSQMEAAFQGLKADIERIMPLNQRQDICDKLEALLYQLSRSELGPKLKEDLERRAKAVFGPVKECAGELTDEVVGRINELVSVFEKSRHKSSQELKEIVDAIAKATSEPKTEGK